MEKQSIAIYLILAITALVPVFGFEHDSTTVLPWLEFDWSEADQLFQQDHHWLGGDGAYSIDLGDERVLWLFGDSWIDPSGSGRRRGATMVSNSIAIQYGYDPSSASIEFFWKTGANGQPKAFFPDFKKGRYWPGHGVRIGDQLLVFLMKVQSSRKGLGFEVSDWASVLVANPDQNPDDWDCQWLKTPKNDLQIIIGSGGVLAMDSFVYAFGSQEPEARHDVYLVRWLKSDVVRGKLENINWWSGHGETWVGQTERNKAKPVFTNGQTEFTVHYDEKSQMFVEFQTVGFGPAMVTCRVALSITGPWSQPDTVFIPPQCHFPQVMIYQGKAHPYLEGANLVVTYCTNSFDFSDHMRETWLYYPRFVRIK